MVRVVLILIALTAMPAAAQSTLNAEAFDAYTRGKTLYYGNDGEAYGVERYLEGRRVVWSFLDGKCKDGIWYEEAGQICFVYEDSDGPQCWTFQQTQGGLVAQFQNDPSATELYEARDMGDEMLCYGPDIGV